MKVPFHIPWITKEDKKAMIRSLEQRWLTLGPILSSFENEFSKYTTSPYSIGVSTATHALHLSLHALDIGPSDEVIVPTMTFAATADVASYMGAKPILADVDSDTYNISASNIRKKITKRTKAVIVVHYGGQSCDMDEIEHLCKEKGLRIIEDCAHSLGSKYKNKMCGTMGIMGCYSFYPTKIITTGEGGMVVTANKRIATRISSLRTHGMNITPVKRERKRKWKYDILEMGYNYRMDEMRAALGLSQLKRVNTINKKRINIAKKYSRELGKIKGITIPITKDLRNHIFHLYTIKIEKDFPLTRDELFLKLSSKGIGTSVQYTPLHLMTYMKKKLNLKYEEYPVANKLKDQIISLPIFPTMELSQIEYVIETIKNS